jgi:hypothetical protein
MKTIECDDLFLALVTKPEYKHLKDGVTTRFLTRVIGQADHDAKPEVIAMKARWAAKVAEVEW